MSIGTVKWFKSDKGFGFITCKEYESDVFVHHTEIQMEGFRFLEQGDKVSFEAERNEKGYIAKNVVRVEKGELIHEQ